MGCHRATPTGAAGERAGDTGRKRVEAQAVDRSLSPTPLPSCHLSVLEWRTLESDSGTWGKGVGMEGGGGETETDIYKKDREKNKRQIERGAPHIFAVKFHRRAAPDVIPSG